MSPEDIFASQIWPWPDPALKRDSMGRVLFVNAAFLQMYGGTIDDWRGNAVTGWPQPEAPGVPYRFETRLPSEDGEQIYDWMEYTLADGAALAVARNVTYLFQEPDPQPGTVAEPPMQENQFVDASMHNNMSQNAFTQAEPQTAEPQYGEAAPVTQEPVYLQETVQATDPILDTTNYAQVPAKAAPQFDDSLVDISIAPEEPVFQEPVFQEPVHQESVSQESVSQEPVYQEAVHQEPAHQEPVRQEPAYQEPVRQAVVQPEPEVQKEREFDRRPLPIENQDAVLGNNWRDAVIAKAAGVSVPTTVAEDTETEASSEEEAGIRILLAEDNAINALLTRTLLEADGHIVDTVEDGVLAVEAMKTSSYDLIFMDMRMPNMDGLEATRKIRAMSNVPRALPIIALTANAFDDDRNACFDSGMNDFMTKPVSAEELSEMVRTWTKNLSERNAA